MTEKRYKRHLSFVLDDYANGSDRLMTIREVIPRLNELYDENEQLKHDATVLIQANQDYRRENEQLKDALNQRTEQCDTYYKENEQLKAINEYLIEILEHTGATVEIKNIKGDFE